MSAEAASGAGSELAVLRLREFAALRVSGEERVDFLQGQLSQDMTKLTPSQAAPAAWCNRQGRVLCLMVAVEWRDAVHLLLPAEMAETCKIGLSRYILRARVRIEAAEEPVFGCAGGGEKGVAAGDDAWGSAFPGSAWACSDGPGYCAVRLPGNRARALALGEPPVTTAEASHAGLTVDRWRLDDIESELPWIGEAASGKFLAHSLNLDLTGAVSFDKGCYVGQEIIARMEYRGTPKRRMRCVRLPPDAQSQPGERAQHPQYGAVTVIASAHGGDHVKALVEARLSPDRAP